MATNNKSRIGDLPNDPPDLEDLAEDGLPAFDPEEIDAPIVDSDAEQALLEGEDGADQIDDELEESRLTGKQKLLVFLTAVASFFVFTIVFFPLEELIRYQLRGFEKAVAIDFATLDLNLLGDDTMGGFSARLPDNSGGFSSESIQSELSWLDLAAVSPAGLVRFENSEFHMQGFAFDAATMDLNLNIDDANKILTTSKGRVQLLAGGVKFTQLPLDGLPIPISLDELNVRRLNLVMNFSNGSVDFQDSTLVSDLLTARLSGTGRIGGNLGATVLQAKLCLKPAADLETKNPELFTVYIMGGGAAGGELCADISGTVSSPQVNIQRGNSTGFGEAFGNSDAGSGDPGDTGVQPGDSGVEPDDNDEDRAGPGNGDAQPIDAGEVQPDAPEPALDGEDG
ncbi:MAG: type II secretion system protein GspN [Leptospirales bacterium]|jgi:type II secretion system protein N